MDTLARGVGHVIHHRKWLLALLAAAVTLAAAAGLRGMELETGDETMISPDSEAYRDNVRYQAAFGGDTYQVLIEGDAEALVSGPGRGSMLALQDRLSEVPGVHSVVGPAVDGPAAAQGGDLLARLVPDGRHVLLTVRLEGGLEAGEAERVLHDVEDAVSAAGLDAERTLVTGTPKVDMAVQDAMQRNMRTMLALAAGLMLLVISLVFVARWRQLSLPLVILGVFWTFGLAAYGLPLTMVSMAGLPVLIGLGIDFGVQFHSRYEEELSRGALPGAALRTAVRRTGPAVAVAVMAEAIGFLVLLMSSAPMVRDFGLLLTVGVVVLYVGSLLLVLAVLHWRDGRLPVPPERHDPGPSRAGRWAALPSRLALRFPSVVVAVALAAATGGMAVDGRIPVETNVESLMPQDDPVLDELAEVRGLIGGTTEIGVLVEADDVTDPAVVEWMARTAEETDAAHDEVVGHASLASLPAPPGVSTVQALELMPAGVRTRLASGDRTEASMTFTVAPRSTDDLNDLVRRLEEEMDPPPGVDATVTGGQTLTARAVSSLTDNRGVMTLAAAVAIAAALGAVYRSVARPVAVVAPILLVVGWTSGLMYLLGVQLNPLTAVLGALIIGIGSEYTILLMERYHEERRAGSGKREAVVAAVERIGGAITASALTTVAGFSALLFSDFAILQDFGKVTLLSVSLSLLSALVVLPVALVWLDRGPDGAAVRPEAAASGRGV